MFKVADGKLEEARACAKRTYNAAVELFAMLCGKFGLNPLGDGVIVSHAEGYKRGIASNHGDPEHLWRQLGIGYTMDGFRKDVKASMAGGAGSESTDGGSETASGLQAVELKDLSNAEVVARIGALFTADQNRSGILASISLAQFILESGYGKSELAVSANNMFGMKKKLNRLSNANIENIKRQELDVSDVIAQLDSLIKGYPALMNDSTTENIMALLRMNSDKQENEIIKEVLKID